MSDETPPPSGNRWEPTEPSAEPTTEPIPETTTTAPHGRPTWAARTKAGVAGGAVAALLAGGLGGFALGRATADPSEGPGPQQGVTTGFDRDGDGFQGGQGGPGGPGFAPPGTDSAPDGQAPDRSGDDDGPDDGTSGTDSSDT